MAIPKKDKKDLPTKKGKKMTAKNLKGKKSSVNKGLRQFGGG